MSLDFQQVRQQVTQLGEQAPLRAEHLRALMERAMTTLHDQARDNRILRDKVQAALAFNPHLRCALPGDEPLDAAFPLPPLPQDVPVLAADGSQINPDRHASVDYCLVNVGAIQMCYGSPESPVTTVRSRLIYEDSEMYTPAGRITERLVALRRDLRERQLLAELAAGQPKPLITLTDGPLELWVGREDEADGQVYKKYFKDYLAALRKLHRLGASAAGYIDRPRGDLLVRLLEIALLPLDELEDAGRRRPLLGVTDADLFRRALKSGERSAVFGIQSRNAGQYAAELALNFFYLNVGRDEKHPYPVRVEIPTWVVDSPEMLDQIHAILVDQCRILGTRTYPYLLHRSHEVAVVTRDEKQQVEQMITRELQRRRILPVGLPSEKQAVKDLPGRTRLAG
jgi:hypothetical protein